MSAEWLSTQQIWARSSRIIFLTVQLLELVVIPSPEPMNLLAKTTSHSWFQKLIFRQSSHAYLHNRIILQALQSGRIPQANSVRVPHTQAHWLQDAREILYCRTADLAHSIPGEGPGQVGRRRQ